LAEGSSWLKAQPLGCCVEWISSSTNHTRRFSKVWAITQFVDAFANASPFERFISDFAKRWSSGASSVVPDFMRSFAVTLTDSRPTLDVMKHTFFTITLIAISF
jgi:hypothetical protein